MHTTKVVTRIACFHASHKYSILRQSISCHSLLRRSHRAEICRFGFDLLLSWALCLKNGAICLFELKFRGRLFRLVYSIFSCSRRPVRISLACSYFAIRNFRLRLNCTQFRLESILSYLWILRYLIPIDLCLRNHFKLPLISAVWFILFVGLLQNLLAANYWSNF